MTNTFSYVASPTEEEISKIDKIQNQKLFDHVEISREKSDNLILSPEEDHNYTLYSHYLSCSCFYHTTIYVQNLPFLGALFFFFLNL
jgi:hypothetical protein